MLLADCGYCSYVEPTQTVDAAPVDGVIAVNIHPVLTSAATALVTQGFKLYEILWFTERREYHGSLVFHTEYPFPGGGVGCLGLHLGYFR